MSRIFIALLVFFVSCSSLDNVIEPVDSRIDKEFQPFVREFQKLFNEKAELSISFSEEDDPMYAGVCGMKEDGERIILINKPLWPKLSRNQKEELIMHELGHCVLNLDHIPGAYSESRCPVSLMAPVLFTEYQGKACYEKHKVYYIDQIKVALRR